jgi:hypothetical protein
MNGNKNRTKGQRTKLGKYEERRTRQEAGVHELRLKSSQRDSRAWDRLTDGQTPHPSSSHSRRRQDRPYIVHMLFILCRLCWHILQEQLLLILYTCVSSTHVCTLCTGCPTCTDHSDQRRRSRMSSSQNVTKCVE